VLHSQRNATLDANPKSGVYFSIDFAADTAESPDDAPLMPDGYFDSGLSFNLNANLLLMTLTFSSNQVV
jgi:hypothetical protein